MILEIIIIVLSLLVVIFGYTTFNLLRKNEKAEDILVSQQEFIDKIEETITFSEKRLKQIDNQGEIGWFFNEIKVLQKKLSQFKINS